MQVVFLVAILRRLHRRGWLVCKKDLPGGLKVLAHMLNVCFFVQKMLQSNLYSFFYPYFRTQFKNL